MRCLWQLRKLWSVIIGATAACSCCTRVRYPYHYSSWDVGRAGVRRHRWGWILVQFLDLGLLTVLLFWCTHHYRVRRVKRRPRPAILVSTSPVWTLVWPMRWLLMLHPTSSAVSANVWPNPHCAASAVWLAWLVQWALAGVTRMHRSTTTDSVHWRACSKGR